MTIDSQRIVAVDTTEIVDFSSFHAVFARVFGFPDFYGGNMDAWIDCMTSLDDPDDGMSTVHAPPGGVVVVQLGDVGAFAARCPDVYAALVECAAFVNFRRLERGAPAVLALSFNK